jgi:hypothetical protein
MPFAIFPLKFKSRRNKMKLANTLFAAAAIVALAGPAFAQSAPTLVVGPSSASASVTTTVSSACALEGTLALFNMSISPNGAVTTAAPSQNLKVTCNTPNGNITIGSIDMVNSAAPTILETAAFTNVIKFTGQADGLMGTDAWRLDSRANGSLASAATVGFDTTRRVRNLVVSVESVAATDGKLPVAGAYSGTICLTVDPSGSLSGAATSGDTDSVCNIAV